MSTTTTLNPTDTKIDLAIHERTCDELRSALALKQAEIIRLERRVVTLEYLIKKYYAHRGAKVLAGAVAECREEGVSNR